VVDPRPEPGPGNRQPGALGLGGGCGYGHGMRRIGAVLIGIDGVLTVSWKPLEGAVATLQRLRTEALPLALVTNTTSRTRASIAAAGWAQDLRVLSGVASRKERQPANSRVMSR
jgi:hypothetical protein